MWTIVSSLQFISYVSLIKINFPGNLLIFLDYLNEVHNYNSLLPNIFSYFMDKTNLTLVPYNSQYEARGIANRNILLLVGADLQILIFSLLGLFCLSIFNITQKYIYIYPYE